MLSSAVCSSFATESLTRMELCAQTDRRRMHRFTTGADVDACSRVGQKPRQSTFGQLWTTSPQALHHAGRQCCAGAEPPNVLHCSGQC